MAEPTANRSPRPRPAPAAARPLSVTVRRWAPFVVLSLFSLAAWNRAEAADVEDARIEAVPYDRRLGTPVLSARRIPQTLQAPIAAAALRPSVDAVVTASPPGSCLVVRDEGRILEDRSGDLALIPASNQKLITTWAALNVFGPEHRFRTAVRADSPVAEGGVVNGNLYLVGGGDPFLGTDSWWAQFTEVDGRTRTRLETLADAVVAAGVRSVTGVVVGDESYLDSQRVAPWAERLIESRQSGPLSALGVNQGFVSWPPVFDGTFRARVPSNDPPLDAAGVFAELLTERGVAVGSVAAGVAPVAAVELAVIDSAPMIELITHVNSYSDNYGAELLLKHLGRERAGVGSTAAGAGVVATMATEAGLPMDGVVIVDGSGLAEANSTTCRFYATLLERSGERSPLVESLSISGQRGSLVARWVDTPIEGQVYAKTGTLIGVSALSGVAHSLADADTSLVFSYVVNGDLVGQSDAIRQLHTPLLDALVAYPSGPSLDTLAPFPPTD